MGLKAPAETKPTMGGARDATGDDGEDLCPDSWEMADLEESMKRLMPAAHREEEKRLDFGADAATTSTSFTSSSSSIVSSSSSSSLVDEFLREALQNPQDRLTILRLEQEVERFVKNPRQHQLEFPPMASSYMRLAVHRVAQHHFLLTSVMDSTSPETCRIIVRKSGENKHPAIRLADVPVAWDGGSSSGTKFVIKQRQRPQGFLSPGAGGDGAGSASGSGGNASKTVEERNEEYNRARARIFEMEQRGVGGIGYQDHHPPEVERPESRKPSKPPEVQDHQVAGKRGGKVEDHSKSRQKVAIFRDREKDRKDPDYDRNYDRYSQRFDPGFGLTQPVFVGGNMQARYSPALNYNTEFPQLGCPPRQAPPPSGQPGPQPWFQAGGQPGSFNHPRGPPPPAYMSHYPYPRPSMAAYPYSPQVSQPETSSAQARRQ